MVVAVLLVGGCAADGLPVGEPTPDLAKVAVSDMAHRLDMAQLPDLAGGDMTESPEPSPPPVDCGYAIGGACCPDGSCALGACDATNHCR